MNKKNFFFLLCALAVCALPSLTSCSGDDDDDDDDGSGEAAELSVPASIVDGVRLSGMTGAGDLSVVYNSDGSIDQMSYNGTDYDFEYEETRAATSTGRRLLAIVARYSYDGDRESWIANSFKFNTDGFIVSYKEHVKGSYSDGSREEYKNNLTLSYGSKGRLSKVNVSSSWTDVDSDGEKESGSGGGSIKYSYSGDNLTQVSVGDAEEMTTFTYEYTTTPNTYNNMTEGLSYGMATYSPILYIFARLGFLGNASAFLPSQMVYRTESYDEGEKDVDTEKYSFSYELDSHNRIDAEVMWNDYLTYRLVYTWTKIWSEE